MSWSWDKERIWTVLSWCLSSVVFVALASVDEDAGSMIDPTPSSVPLSCFSNTTDSEIPVKENLSVLVGVPVGFALSILMVGSFVGWLFCYSYVHPISSSSLSFPTFRIRAVKLHDMAECGPLSKVKKMIEEKEYDVKKRDRYGNIPLHFAALGGHVAIVKYLIFEKGCDPMSRNIRQETPLHKASQKGNLAVVTYLLEDVKVYPSCRDENDSTPLHVASLNGHLSVVKLLVEEYLCDPDVRDKSGATATDKARKDEVINYLQSIAETVCTDLRRDLVSQLKPYTRKANPTGKVLGTGSFSKVIELTSAGEVVAGKVFRTTSSEHLQASATTVCGELILMLQLNHPNVVRCKGVSLLTDQHLPVLLMERLETSLYSYLLDPQHDSLPLDKKISILCDIARGLVYLHSHTPAIIHRDLTAKNVLLDSKLTAKLGDFGNSRIIDFDPEASPETLTCMPGTLQYMPPEALGEGKIYDSTLDVFSFGHLALFVILQLPVQTLPSTYVDKAKVRGRSEVKRRVASVKKAEELLSEHHPLLTLIKECLHNNAPQRPRTGELLTRLRDMAITCDGVDGPLECVDADNTQEQRMTEQGSKPTEESAHVTHEATGVERGEILPTTPRIASLNVLQCPNGQKIEIIGTVASKWKNIGYLLDFDVSGETLQRIEADEGQKGVESCCQCMFQYWLKGNGVQPASWATLLAILEDCHYNNLTAQIKTALDMQLL